MKQFLTIRQKRDFSRKYHQQGATPKDSDKNIEFILGENYNLKKKFTQIF